jgi:Fic family protein
MSKLGTIGQMEENYGEIFNPRQLDENYKTFPDFSSWAKTTFSESRWNRYVQTLNERKTATPKLLAEAQEVVKRATAVDTGAIEGLYDTDRGFTFTIAVEAAMWQAKVESAKGPHVRALIESQVAAYDYVLDLATQETPISEASIRRLHEIVCQSQDTYTAYTEVGLQQQQLIKGQYKIHPNHVRKNNGTHSYAPVDLTTDEMYRLCQELRSEAFCTAHPVLQASYAHYAFVVIHPFADGNGRVARALGSVFTYRAQSVPLLILAENRLQYIEALETADGGNFAPLVDFILDSTLASMQMVEESIKTASTLDIAALLPRFERLNRTKSGYTHFEIDNAANELIYLVNEEIRDFIKKKVDSTQSYIDLTVDLINLGGPGSTSTEYRTVKTNDASAVLTIIIKAKTLQLHQNASASSMYYLIVPKDGGINDDMLLVSLPRGQNSVQDAPAFNAQISDVLPRISTALQMRVKMLAQRLVNELVGNLYATARIQQVKDL